MEAKAEAEEESTINSNKQYRENSTTVKEQNGNGNEEIESSLTIGTGLAIKEIMNASIVPVKDEMETSADNIDEKVQDPIDTAVIKDEPQTDCEEKQIKNEISAESEQTIEKSREVTEDESEPSKKVNPLKRKRSRPAKRKRKTKMNRVMVTNNKAAPTEAPESDPSVDTSTEVKDDVEFCLTVSNLPKSWSFMEIKNYIDTECGPVDEIEMIKDDKTGIGAIRLSYQTDEECKSALQKLKDKEVAGHKLVLDITVVCLESDTESKSETTEANKKPWKPDLDSWEVDLHGMYGLKLQYLRSLGISPPLDKWVHVSNFRCDKSELRDVMEMAGNVQMCSVFVVAHRYANVMYSHPLEAVQAVSMLNNQMFYGQQLKVAMDRSPIDTILLPKGLSNIGKGLGLNGKPLKNIVKHYERFLENKDCLINPAVFDIPENHSMTLNDGFESVKFQVKSVEEFNYPIAADKAKKTDNFTTVTTTSVQTAPTPKPIQTPPKTNIQTPAFTISQSRVSAPVRANFTPAQNYQQRPFAPNFGQFPGPQAQMNGPGMMGQQGPGTMGPPGPMGPQGHMGPIGSPMQPRPQPHPGLAGPPRTPGQFVRPFPGPMNPGQGPMRPGWGHGPMRPPGPMGPPGPMYPNEPVKLILTNLPPSTTFALLCEKMSEWGHVVCIQLTTPGCAVVTFANRMQADACLQHYNGRNIDNHFIQIKYA